MTVYGWDISNFDWQRGPVDLAAARTAGIALVTHKVTEGTAYRDPYAGQALTRAAAAGIPVIGGYHVLYPSSQLSIASQVQTYLAALAAAFPAWRSHACFIHQLDCERWGLTNNQAPTLADIIAFGKALEADGVNPRAILAYAPGWVYPAGSLTGLPYHLWQSDYGTNPAAHFIDAYPGDGSPRWGHPTGIVPAVLQYGSQTVISQPICDANALRVADEAQLVALFSEDTLSAADVAAINAHTDAALGQVRDALVGEIRNARSALTDAIKAIPTAVPVDPVALAAALTPALVAAVQSTPAVDMTAALQAALNATTATLHISTP